MDEQSALPPEVRADLPPVVPAYLAFVERRGVFADVPGVSLGVGSISRLRAEVGAALDEPDLADAVVDHGAIRPASSPLPTRPGSPGGGTRSQSAWSPAARRSAASSGRREPIAIVL